MLPVQLEVQVRLFLIVTQKCGAKILAFTLIISSRQSWKRTSSKELLKMTSHFAEQEQLHWHAMTEEEVAKTMQTDVTQGLSDSDAEKRFAKYGPNMMTEKRKKTIWERIWEQINNVLVFILIIVAVVSLVKATTSDGDGMYMFELTALTSFDVFFSHWLLIVLSSV